MKRNADAKLFFLYLYEMKQARKSFDKKNERKGKKRLKSQF